MVEGDVGHFLTRHFCPFEYEDMLMTGPRMADFSASLTKLKADFPRRKLHDIIEALQDGRAFKPILKTGLSFCPPERREDLAMAAAELAGDDPARWFTVADLWDYA